MFAMDEEGLKTGEARPLVVVDWASRKLPRVCRSSLAAEAQAACIAVDALEWAKVFIGALLNPGRRIDDPTMCKEMGESPVITDAKALYDASRSASAGLGLSEKRTAIELNILNERMEAICGVWKWVDNTKMIADGLTKLQSRQELADILRKGYHALKFDGEVKAGKKQTQRERQQHQRELDACANQTQKKRSTGATPAGKKIFAAALLAEAAEGTALVAVGSCSVGPYGSNEGYTIWAMLKTLLLGVILGFLLALTLYMKYRSSTNKKVRTVKTQSQTRYAMDRAEPRFLPLHERDQGAWMSFDDAMERHLVPEGRR